MLGQNFNQRILLLSILLLLNPLASFCTGGVENQAVLSRRDLEMGFYVVIGSFNIYENAQRFTKDLVKKGQPCDFAYSDTHHHYYAYTFHSDSLQLVKNELIKLREKTKFKDSWILKINKQLTEKRLDEHADVEKERLQVDDKNITENDHSHDQHHPHHDLTKTHNSYKIYVNPCDSNLRPIHAHIKVVNGEKSVFLKTIETQKTEIISCPKSYAQGVELICDDALGYKKKVFFIDLSAPLNDTTNAFVKLDGDQIVVNLPMKPMEKGDVMTLYNVFFFPNTNILRTKSNFELEKLLEILKNNKNLVVLINGHVNGHSSGPITRLKEDCSDFFNPTDTELINGTAQKLSELRSETIKYYLIRNGIDYDRIQTKGWGGKKMLFKEDSPQYQYNVRVEVEILKN